MWFQERFLVPSFTLLPLALSLAGYANAQDAPNGRALFEENCAGCHGTGGAGDRGPSLQGQLRHGNQLPDIKNVIVNGLPGTGMPKFDFDDHDLQALIPYVQSLSQKSGSGTHPHGDPIAGRKIYDSGKCSGCHKIGSEGSSFGPNLTRVGAARSYDYLKTSILSPSADVPENFEGVTVVDGNGKRYSGIRVNEDTFTVQLRLPDQSFVSFDKQSIKSEVMEKQSVMPSYKFEAHDLQNLLSYLSSLVGPANSTAGITEEPRLR